MVADDGKIDTVVGLPERQLSPTGVENDPVLADVNVTVTKVI